ncbi:hypothetical protein V1264_023389 [Littorina saxatilis]|uniref:Uncharacterized protein n=1 Tax=Littorina saxatilis TaxID=31220 RepID=A0AAN9GAE6_9CAEN
MSGQKRKRDYEDINCAKQGDTSASVCSLQQQQCASCCTPVTSSILTQGTNNNTTTTNNNHSSENNRSTAESSSKRQAGEGFSWWTCLQYDMSLDRSKPQAVKERINSHSINKLI